MGKLNNYCAARLHYGLDFSTGLWVGLGYGLDFRLKSQSIVHNGLDLPSLFMDGFFHGFSITQWTIMYYNIIQ